MHLGLFFVILFAGILDIYMTGLVIKYKQREQEMKKEIALYKQVFLKFEEDVRRKLQDIENNETYDHYTRWEWEMELDTIKKKLLPDFTNTLKKNWFRNRKGRLQRL